MNIFKVLAHGDGTLNEPNISAFLGYLLDPNADHGLNYDFLKEFLSTSLGEKYDFDVSKFECKIYLEQAFLLEEKKKIVDIILVCYSYNIENKKESLVHQFMNNNKTIEKLFLIENKISLNTSSDGQQQLEDQFNATLLEINKTDLANLSKNIYSIYVSPDGVSHKEVFNNANIPGCKSHIVWKDNSDDVSIVMILKKILNNESEGETEPINENIAYTIKAFIQFINSGFKSELQEEKVRKEKGEDVIKNEEAGIEGKLMTIRELLLNENIFEGKNMLVNMSPTNPSLYMNLENSKIQLLLRNSAKDLGYFNIKALNSHDPNFENLALKMNAKYLSSNGRYFKIPGYKKGFNVNDFQIIETIKKIKERLESA